jgi:hypothetical protein
MRIPTISRSERWLLVVFGLIGYAGGLFWGLSQPDEFWYVIPITSGLTFLWAAFLLKGNDDERRGPDMGDSFDI